MPVCVAAQGTGVDFLGWPLRTSATGISARAKRPPASQFVPPVGEGSWSRASVPEAEVVLVARHQLPDRPWQLLSGLPLEPFRLKAGPRTEKG